MQKGIVAGMDCKEFEKLIPDYIAKKLDYLTLKRFSEHMEKCENCKEELTIKFLVTEGIQRLEDGSAFDLQKELSQRMEEAKAKINTCGKFMNLGLALEIFSLCILVGIVICIML